MLNKNWYSIKAIKCTQFARNKSLPRISCTRQRTIIKHHHVCVHFCRWKSLFVFFFTKAIFHVNYRMKASLILIHLILSFLTVVCYSRLSHFSWSEIEFILRFFYFFCSVAFPPHTFSPFLFRAKCVVSRLHRKERVSVYIMEKSSM